MRVAVFGATGTVGRALLPLLTEEHEVVGVSRRGAPAGANSGVMWVQADVADPHGVAAALTGVDVAYYLVHSLGPRTSSSATAKRQTSSPLRRNGPACVRSSTWAVSERMRTTSRHTCGADARRASGSRPGA